MAAKPVMARRALTAASRMGGKPRGCGLAHSALGALEQGGFGRSISSCIAGRRVSLSAGVGVCVKAIGVATGHFLHSGEWQRHVLPCAEDAPQGDSIHTGLIDVVVVIATGIIITITVLVFISSTCIATAAATIVTITIRTTIRTTISTGSRCPRSCDSHATGRHQVQVQLLRFLLWQGPRRQ